MGWFWDSKTSDGSTNDPYQNLDPALRQFLDKESPLKYEDTKPRTPPPSHPSAPSTDAAPRSFRSLVGLDAADADGRPEPSTGEQRAVPRESLFQDGRYAHIWKDYRPQAEVEAAGKSDSDRLTDVIEAFQGRKAAIGRAAMENCVELQFAEQDCWKNGSWTQRMKMCSDESKAFKRCFNMQNRFLKALGYLATQRTEDEEERIQMHADKLWHEMLDRERVALEAKEQGLEAPEHPPLIEPESTTKALGENSAWAQARRKAIESGMSTDLSSFRPERQEDIKKAIQGLSKEERELELQLLTAESRAQVEYADKFLKGIEEERHDRQDRRARGKETIGDTIKRLWGWDQ